MHLPDLPAKHLVARPAEQGFKGLIAALIPPLGVTIVHRRRHGFEQGLGKQTLGTQAFLGLATPGDVPAHGLIFQQIARIVENGPPRPALPAQTAVRAHHPVLETGGGAPGRQGGDATGHHGPVLFRHIRRKIGEPTYVEADPPIAGKGGIDEHQPALRIVPANQFGLVLDDGTIPVLTHRHGIPGHDAGAINVGGRAQFVPGGPHHTGQAGRFSIGRKDAGLDRNRYRTGQGGNEQRAPFGQIQAHRKGRTRALAQALPGIGIAEQAGQRGIDGQRPASGIQPEKPLGRTIVELAKKNRLFPMPPVFGLVEPSGHETGHVGPGEHAKQHPLRIDHDQSPTAGIVHAGQGPGQRKLGGYGHHRRSHDGLKTFIPD